MGGVDVLEAFSIVGSSLVVNQLVFIFDLDGEDLHTVDKLLCVCGIVFWEVHINETSQGMTVSTHSHNSVFVGVTIYDLLLQASSFVSWTDILTLLGVYSFSTKDSSLLLSIKLLNSSLFFLLDPCLVFCLQFSDLGIVFFLEGLVFLHDTVHVAFIHIHHNYFLTIF